MESVRISAAYRAEFEIESIERRSVETLQYYAAFLEALA